MGTVSEDINVYVSLVVSHEQGGDICRDLRAFSGVIFPSFDKNSNIFAIFIEQKSYG